MPVFMEAVHTVKPLTNRTFTRWVELYGELIVPAFERHGFGLLGAWQRFGGPMGQDVLLFRYDSLTEMEKARASLMRDRVLLERFPKAVQEAGIRVEESSKLATPVPYATEQRLRAVLARPAAPRRYLQAVLQLTLGGQPKAYSLIEQLAARMEQAGVQLATAYETDVGTRGQLTDLWALPAFPDFAYRPGEQNDDLIGALREVAPEESFYLLSPLPYSPMQ